MAPQHTVMLSPAVVTLVARSHDCRLVPEANLCGFLRLMSPADKGTAKCGFPSEL